MKAFVAAISLLALRRIVKLAYTAPLWGPQWNNLFNEIVNVISFESDTLERYETRTARNLNSFFIPFFLAWGPAVSRPTNSPQVFGLGTEKRHFSPGMPGLGCYMQRYMKRWLFSWDAEKYVFVCLRLCLPMCICFCARALHGKQNGKQMCAFSTELQNKMWVHVPCEQSLLALVRLLTDSVWNAWKFTKKKTLGYLMVLKSVRIPYKANEKSKYTTRSEQIRSRWCRPHGW